MLAAQQRDAVQLGARAIGPICGGLR